MSDNSNSATTGATLIQKKRFANELKLLNSQPLGYITAYPDEKNPLIWYFLVVGQKGTQYYTGHYIGEIHHSPKYPAEPPNYYMRTPSGRYEINSKICLTNSSYHRGDWSSTWNIQSILIAFYSIWLDDSEHGISHIKRSAEERAKLAKESIDYNIKNYKKIYEKFDFTTLTNDIDNAPKPKPPPAPTPVASAAVSTLTPAPTSAHDPVSTPGSVDSVPVVPVVPVIPVVPVVSVTETNHESKTVFSKKLEESFNEVNSNINRINKNIREKDDEINNLLSELKK